MRRISAKTALTLAGLPLLTLALAGCNELVDTDRFRVVDGATAQRDAAAGRDGGGEDDGGGSDTDGGGGDEDACTARVWYRDSDMDGFASDAVDVETTMACTAPEGFVNERGDCDDTRDDVRPGQAEVCDDVDQDCDGALDEGLIGPIGELITARSSYRTSPRQGAGVAAYEGGFAMVFADATDLAIHALFYQWNGRVFSTEDVIVRESTSTEPARPRITSLIRDGLEQVFILWEETDGLWASVCEIDASDCSSAFRFFEGNPADVDDLGLAQVDETRVAVWWTEPSGLRVTVVSTSFGAPTSILVPGFTDAETGFGGGAVVSGPESTRLLFARISEPDLTSLGPDSGVALPDGTRWVNRAEVLSVGVSSAGALSFDMSADVQPWDPSASCTAVGTPYCAVAFLLFTGRGTLNEPSLLGITGVAGFDEGDAGVPVLELCARGTTPRADGPPEVGPCQELPSPAFSAVDRGTVATAATFVTSGFRLRELPLSPEADGSPFVNLPGISLLLPGVATYLSMHGARGVALGNAEDPSGFDLTLQRLGCEP